MEKPLSFVSKLSLEEMALRRVAVNLWISSDILPAFLRPPIKWNPEDEDEYEEWLASDEDQIENIEEERETVEKVKAKVSNLVIPESLKKRMMNIVKPIGSDILKWKTQNEKLLSKASEHLDVHILGQLRWTCTCAVDYKKTAERLIRLKLLNIVNRYKLACLFCLENYIPFLWKELPEENKSYFYDKRCILSIEELQMEFYWAYVLKGEESKLDDTFRRLHPSDNLTFHQYAFGRSAVKGNKAATEHFFQKLTCEERGDFLISTACNVVLKRCTQYAPSLFFEFPNEKVSDVLCYLLSVMRPEQQMRVFKKDPAEVLSCFLDWPLQDIFLDVADIIWSIPRETSHNPVEAYILQTIAFGSYYFPDLIQKFFLRIPRDFREHFLLAFGVLFSISSYKEDADTLKVVFRNIDREGRAELFSSYWFLHLLEGLILQNNWHLFELCLREAAHSKEDRERMKEAIISHLPERLKCSRLKRCFELLDETEASAPDNRNSEINHSQTLQ